MFPVNSRPTSYGGNDYYTQVLLHFDGNNGGTTYTDSSKNNLTITRDGTSTLSNTKSKFGGTSLSCSATGGCSFADSASYEPGSSDWTVDMWVYPTSSGTFQCVFAKGASYAPILIANNSGAWAVYSSSTGTSWDKINALSMGTYTLNSWQHLAITRVGTTVYPFVNGTLGTTVTVSGALLDNASSWNLGSQSGGNSLSGYIDEFRYTLGVGRWTSSFNTLTDEYR